MVDIKPYIWIDVLVYDISTDQWTSENLMPIPLQGSCAIQHNGKILLLGGKNEKISGKIRF